MSRVIAFLSLFVFALQAAGMGVGVITLCKHLDGESHQVSAATHQEESHGECCHHDDASHSDEINANTGCGSCVDTEIDTSERNDAIKSNDRVSASADLAKALVAIEVEDFSPSKSTFRGSLAPARGPPLSLPQVAIHIETTILRI